MDIIDDVIKFKSDPGMYTLESTDMKPNTIRLLHRKLANILTEDNIKRIQEIEISNSETGDSFKRTISSIISIDKYFHIKDGFKMVVFSWYPEDIENKEQGTTKHP